MHWSWHWPLINWSWATWDWSHTNITTWHWHVTLILTEYLALMHQPLPLMLEYDLHCEHWSHSSATPHYAPPQHVHLLECLGFDAGTRELKPNMTIDTQPGVAVHNSRPELKLNQDFHDAQWKRRLTCYLTVSSQYLFNGWLKYWLFSTGYFSRKVCKLKGRLRTHDCTKQTKVLLCTFLSVPGKFSVMKLAGYQQSTFLIFKEKNSAHMIHSS